MIKKKNPVGEVLERILEAGLKTPSSNHRRRWELVTQTDKNIITVPYYHKMIVSSDYISLIMEADYRRTDERNGNQMEHFKDYAFDVHVFFI